MVSITIREDFRRDGIAANFLANSKLIELATKSFPGMKINIGYPGICQEEYQACKEILLNNANRLEELSVVGHTRKSHLEKLAEITKLTTNSAANIWIPVSNDFIKKTLKTEHIEVLKLAKESINNWKNISEKPLDIALADCTRNELEIKSRIVNWSGQLLDMGYRNIIIADSRGIGESKKIYDLFNSFDSSIKERIEFHPHDDNGNGMKNIEAAIKAGISTIGTAIYKSGERKSMIDPRELISKGLKFEKKEFKLFEKEYKKQIGNHEHILEMVYGNNIIVTGTQYRLRNRQENLEVKFGITSDKYILGKLLGLKKNEISKELLYSIKNSMYKTEQIITTQKELKQIYLQTLKK